MAILVRSNRSGRASLRALFVLVILGASGCLVLEQLGWNSSGLGFNHAIHVLQEEMECVDCHMDYEDSDLAGMPPLEDCLLCHGEDEEDIRPIPVADFYDEDGEYLRDPLHDFPDEVVFSHQAHVTDEEGCLDCHGDLVQGSRVRSSMALDMDSCLDCHIPEGIGEDCASCHAEIRQNVSPPTHDGTWGKHHGLSVRNRSDLTADRCDMCHEPASCTGCHSEEPPDNHNNFWRRRGHGLTAQMDRQNCAACHRQDACDRCHEEARPVTHRGLWGGSRNTHCYSCHLTDGEQSCSLCHRQGAPSHAMAPPKPPGHDPASDCRSCHVILTHVDKGDDCNFCHQ